MKKQKRDLEKEIDDLKNRVQYLELRPPQIQYVPYIPPNNINPLPNYPVWVCTSEINKQDHRVQ